MKSKEESSVKLDLGRGEEEEEEESEEEEEEEIIEESQDEDQEEEEDDDEVIDLNAEESDAPEEANVIQNQAEESENVQSEGEQQKGQNMSPQQTRKRTGSQNFTTPKHMSTMQKLFHKTAGSTSKFAGNQTGEKSVFTMISEDLFSKLISSKDNQRVSAYEYLINDRYLERIYEKKDKSSGNKFKNFVARNMEFRDNKKIKLQNMANKVSTEEKTKCSGVPNGKMFAKEELRDPETFLNDQINYYQNRDMLIERRKKEILEGSHANMKNAPEISLKSKKLAEIKSSESEKKAVYERLFVEKMNKEKKHVYDESKKTNKKKANGGDNLAKKEQSSKKSKQEVQQIVEKLFKDAEERKKKKDKVERDRIKIKEVLHLYDSDDEIVSRSSTLKILEKFVQSYELSLLNLFNKKDSLLITFEEFCNLMLVLGFTRYDRRLNPSHQDEQDEKNNKKREKELDLLKDAWKVLDVQQPEENEERIDTNQLLVFLAAMLGLYKGEDNKENINKTNSANEDKQELPVNTNPSENQVSEKKDIESVWQKKSPKKAKKPAKIPNRFSTPLERRNFSSTDFAAKTKKEPKPIEKNLLKLVIPELDTKKYFFPKKTVKHIKSLFRYFYDNRVVHLVEDKKKAREAKKVLQEETEQSTRRTEPTEAFKRSAEKFRNRVLNELEAQGEENSNQTIMQSPHTTEARKNKHKYQLDKIYDVLKKKKEK